MMTFFINVAHLSVCNYRGSYSARVSSHGLRIIVPTPFFILPNVRTLDGYVVTTNTELLLSRRVSGRQSWRGSSPSPQDGVRAAMLALRASPRRAQLRPTGYAPPPAPRPLVPPAPINPKCLSCLRAPCPVTRLFICIYNCAAFVQAASRGRLGGGGNAVLSVGVQTPVLRRAPAAPSPSVSPHHILSAVSVRSRRGRAVRRGGGRMDPHQTRRPGHFDALTFGPFVVHSDSGPPPSAGFFESPECRRGPPTYAAFGLGEGLRDPREQCRADTHPARFACRRSAALARGSKKWA